MEIISGVWQFDIEIHCIINRLGARSFDYVRTGLNKNLGFTPEDREENIRRVAEVNIFLALELQVEFEEPGLKKSRILAAGLPGTFDCCQLPEANKFCLARWQSYLLTLALSHCVPLFLPTRRTGSWRGGFILRFRPKFS